MKKYNADILNKLIDKFERSKSFLGQNTIGQSFTIKPTDICSKYMDESEYENFKAVNDSIAELQSLGFVLPKFQRNGVCVSIKLCTEVIDKIYIYLMRTPKMFVYAQLQELLNAYKSRNGILSAYCEEQLSRLSENKTVKYFDDSVDEYKLILKALSEVLDVKTETYQRDFSVKVFGDSKIFEKIKPKVISILYEYGDFPEKETVLEDLNIIRNPGHVYFKGNGRIVLKDQTVEFSKFNGDIAVSSSLLSQIDRIEALGDVVMTIENLTTFNSFNDKKVFAIYLGGYHNADRRAFIRKIHEQNPKKVFLHFGDIDAGGFHILLHLCNRTGVNFKPYHMDIDTLKQYSAYTKPLTDGDRKRLQNLLQSDFAEVIQYMLDNNCKLEQEAVD